MYLNVDDVLFNLDHVLYITLSDKKVHLQDNKFIDLSDYEDEWFYLMNHLNDNQMIL